MQPPDKVPDAVIQSIANRHIKWEGCCCRDPEFCPRSKPVMKDFQRYLRELRWSGDHYSFNFAGMYVGVELDGYMHT